MRTSRVSLLNRLKREGFRIFRAMKDVLVQEQEYLKLLNSSEASATAAGTWAAPCVEGSTGISPPLMPKERYL